MEKTFIEEFGYDESKIHSAWHDEIDMTKSLEELLPRDAWLLVRPYTPEDKASKRIKALHLNLEGIPLFDECEREWVPIDPETEPKEPEE